MEAVELLIRNHLVNMQQYDLHLAQVGNIQTSGTTANAGEGCWVAQSVCVHVDD